MEEYHIQSSLFNFSLPQSNILGLPSQNTQAVADGNRLLLKPLNIDQHEIKCKREVNKTINTSDNNFSGPIDRIIKLHKLLQLDDKRYLNIFL